MDSAIGNTSTVEDFFNAVVVSYTHQGSIDSVHEALQDLQPFPTG